MNLRDVTTTRALTMRAAELTRVQPEMIERLVRLSPKEA
jgi:hypothetical protein